MPLERRVHDLMHPIEHYGQVREDERLQDAIRGLQNPPCIQGPVCLLVVGETPSGDSVITGFLTPANLVFGMAEHFLKGAETIGPIFWEGQLEEECRRAMRKPIREVMTPIRASIRDDEMLMEAIFLLNRHQVDFLPVVREQEVLGLIHLKDILSAITRIGLKPQRK